MPITVLNDVILPNSVLSSGVRGKNARQNSRVALNNGYQSINIVWSKSLRQFEVGFVPMRVDAWSALEAIHEITEGGAYGFLMEDPKDCRVTVAEGRASLVSAGVYQLQRRYTDVRSARYKDRAITRPRAAVFAIFANGVPVAHTLDATTGRVTIASAPTASTLTWSGSFYVPVHFMEDSLDWEMVAPGPAEQRFLAGPSVILQEVRE